VVGLSIGVQAIAAGENHACALTSAGGVKCWGDNSAGQLGDGVTSYSTVPVDTAGLASGSVVVSADNGLHSCAITASGGAKCWGYNGFGQVGNGAISLSVPTPADVVGLTGGAAGISAGGYHTCALTTAGGVRCWGGSDYGQTGDIDRDGCGDAAEQGTSPALGGMRNSIDRWDFFDVPTGAALMRDKSVTVSDISQEVLRFGTMGDETADPLSTPGMTGYHPAYDRGGPAGADVWNQAPANGSITVADIAAMVGQFGHTCV
jgi:hypothetical protein